MEQANEQQQTKRASALRKLLDRRQHVNGPSAAQQQQQQLQELQQQRTDNSPDDDTAAHVRLAQLLAATGRHSQAAKHCSAALQFLDRIADRDELWQMQLVLAHVLVRIGDRDHAIALYRRVLETQPSEPEAHTNLAAQLMIKGELASALVHLDAALAFAPQLPHAHYNKNVVMRRLGQQKEAVGLYWQLITDAIRTDSVADATIAQSCHHTLPKPIAAALPTTEPVTGVSVLCVKAGTKYGAEYVNKLFASIRRHVNCEWTIASTTPFNNSSEHRSRLIVEFVCLTDDPTGIDGSSSDVQCLQLDSLQKNWWSKLALFSPVVAEHVRYEKCVYFDLDTVIVDSLDDLLHWDVPPHTLALLKTDDMANEQRSGGYNSSVMMWRNDRKASSSPLRRVYELMRESFAIVNQFIYKLDHWLEMVVPDALFIDDVFPGAIVEYNQTRRADDDEQSPPQNASVVCFPLEPKPHTATAAWIKHHWSESSG